MMRSVALTLALPLVVTAQLNTTLSPKTVEAFDAYVKTAESQMNGTARFGQLKPDELRIQPASSAGSLNVKDGIVHDWVGATFVPGVTVEQVLAVLQNYSAYKNIYKPDIIDSKLLSHEGNHWQIYLKLVKTKIFTTILNTEYDIRYRSLGEGRWVMISHSTKIAELDDGKELTPGTGRGFLWRLNAYWTIEPRNNGVYMECRSISLSRDVPFGLGNVVGPLIESVPTESLKMTLNSTAQALGRQVASR
jgi:hypothetical protein